MTAAYWADFWAADHDAPTSPVGLDHRLDNPWRDDTASDGDTDREANRHYADGGWPL